MTNVAWNATQRWLTFNRLDDGQPLTFNSNTDTNFNNLVVPFHVLAGYTLKVTNLPAGTYRITIAGQQVADVTNTALGNPGVNLSATAPAAWSYGGPWMFQNNCLLLNATPGSAVTSLLGSADALVGFIQRWAAMPANNLVVVEPAP